MARIHANGTGVRHAIARALATSNLAPDDATFRVRRGRVDLDRDGDVARAEVTLEILPAAPLGQRDAAELRGLVNPDGAHPLMVWLPGDPDTGVAPFFMDILAVSWSRWLARPGDGAAPGGTLPPGIDLYAPHVGSDFADARAFAAAEGKRLPTTAELRVAWGPHRLPWGDAPDPSCGRVGRPRYDQLPEGGAHPPGPGGIFDLGAWLWQWVDDGDGVGRVCGGGPWPDDGTAALPVADRWPVGLRLVQDAS
ncbi:MAG: SUMF1/EgtB/PvdO family nonheme iron enzyme [Alphaproteobacteria bacterium]|nr:SUMF1/EgtB/PvdO family nonheme iron enzyme [Alphaproteobacteria bacterium]